MADVKRCDFCELIFDVDEIHHFEDGDDICHYCLEAYEAELAVDLTGEDCACEDLEDCVC